MPIFEPSSVHRWETLAIRRIAQISPSTKVIVLTNFADDQKVLGLVQAGASSFLLKDVRPQEMAEAILTVSRGDALLHPSIAAKLMREFAGGEHRDAGDLLTRRELASGPP